MKIIESEDKYMEKLVVEGFRSFEDTLDKSRKYEIFGPGIDAWQIYNKLSIKGIRKYETVDKAYNEMIELEEILDDAVDSGNDYEIQQHDYDEAYRKWWKLFDDYKREADAYFQDLIDRGYVELDPIDGFIAVYLD